MIYLRPIYWHLRHGFHSLHIVDRILLSEQL